eukprot:PhM_4_TR13990/c0_g1_i1/m.24558/K18681/DIS3L; DIS3-like exonuclease 1
MSRRSFQKMDVTSVYYETHMSEERALAGAQNGEYVIGTMAIAFDWASTRCFVRQDRGGKDIIINNHADRNRALHNSRVVVKVTRSQMNRHQQVENFGKVIAVLPYTTPQRFACRVAHIKDDGSVLLQPYDSRAPTRLLLDAATLPPGQFTETNSIRDHLIEVEYVHWNDQGCESNPVVAFRRSLGVGMTPVTELTAVLSGHNCLDDALGFPADVEEESERVSDPTYFEKVFKDEIESGERKDIRDAEFIISVDDPETRDIDDALSARLLPNGNYQIGVHIADVSTFVKRGGPMDVEARRRGMSVYHPMLTVPMLPMGVSTVCSLYSGVNKGAVSYFAEVDGKTGAVLSSYVTKTLIHNNARITYEVLSHLLRGNKLASSDKQRKMVHTLNTHVTDAMTVEYYADLEMTVKHLKAVQALLNANRVGNGAPPPSDNIHQSFDTGVPLPPAPRPRRRLHETVAPVAITATSKPQDADTLVEEFMILANSRVARRLCDEMPQAAPLQTQTYPNMGRLCDLLRSGGISYDAPRLTGDHAHDASLYSEIYMLLSTHPTLGEILMRLAPRCSSRGEYWAAGTLGDDIPKRLHYTSGSFAYTHFTSPIRRYFDLEVHRGLVGGADARRDMTLESTAQLCKEMGNVRSQRQHATNASARISWAWYLKQKGPITYNAFITRVDDNGLALYLPEAHHDVKVMFSDMQDMAKGGKLERYDVMHAFPKSVYVKWRNGTAGKLRCFDRVIVRLSVLETKVPMDYTAQVLGEVEDAENVVKVKKEEE